jgi:hypothetical protein
MFCLDLDKRDGDGTHAKLLERMELRLPGRMGTLYHETSKNGGTITRDAARR